jgi:hypothetical protein
MWKTKKKTKQNVLSVVTIVVAIMTNMLEYVYEQNPPFYSGNNSLFSN